MKLDFDIKKELTIFPPNKISYFGKKEGKPKYIKLDLLRGNFFIVD